MRKRLGTMDGFWLLGGTWVLFVAYVAVPIVLFWFLDRTGAVSDTSVFAAFLIGFGYHGIIAGTNQSIPVPGEVSAWWAPFVAYADRVAKAALERGARDQRRLAEKVIAEITGDPKRYDKLVKLALDRTSDPAVVQAALAEIDTKTPGLGDGDKLAKKTRYLYGIVLAVPDVSYLLKDREIVSKPFYWLSLRQYGKRVPFTVAISILALVLAYVGFLSYNSSEVRVAYHSWRLGKTNSSSVDQYRSRYELVKIVHAKPEHRGLADENLIFLVQRPGLPMERVDLVLETLLETHAAPADKELPKKLVQALRVNSMDARARVHDALVFLTGSCTTKPDSTLTAWKPTDKDSSTTLEAKIVAWDGYWTGAVRSTTC